MKYRVLIADDMRIAREGLKKSIQWEKLELELAGLAASGIEAFSLIKETLPDIVITDIKMPGIDGIGLIKKTKELYPGVIFILLSAYGEFEYARQAMKYGVKYYLLKPCNDQKLNDTLVQVIDELKGYKSNREKYLDSYHRTVSGLSTPKGAALIEMVKSYVADNLHESNLSLKYIAANVAYINPDYLGRLFRTHTGEKFSAYLTRIRIEYSKTLIESNPEYKIYEICTLAGFGDNTEYFSQLFKHQTGLSPYDYKKNSAI